MFYHSVLYWTNWGIQPTIEKSNYDGTNRQVIINSGLGFPNGLAVDSQGKVFYIFFTEVSALGEWIHLNIF